MQDLYFLKLCITFDFKLCLSYTTSMNKSLQEKGRLGLSIRKHLRAFVAAQPKPNAYINELIQQDAQKRPTAFIEAQQPNQSIEE